MKGNGIKQALFPSIIAWERNHEIMSNYKKKKWATTETEWNKKLKNHDAKLLQSIVDDVYGSELIRKDTIESKATSLFSGRDTHRLKFPDCIIK
jgi:hypothetical protein